MTTWTDRELHELELLTVTRLVGLKATAPEPTAGRAAEGALGQPPSKKAPSAPVPHTPPEPTPDCASLGWQALREVVRDCRRCRLGESRKQAVFGVGADSAPWLFVGEGPGAEEDAQGEPFVGQAGKLLDGMLAAIKLSRGKDAYITNVVKCRPPGNRVPQADEAAACAGYLDRQVDLLQPKLIVALGKTAAVRLTGEEGSLASQRGRRFTYRGVPLVVTYHPAYLLRNLPDKAKAWEDLLFARLVFHDVVAATQATKPSI